VSRAPSSDARAGAVVEGGQLPGHGLLRVRLGLQHGEQLVGGAPALDRVAQVPDLPVDQRQLAFEPGPPVEALLPP